MNGQVVVITGASSGIGEATAKLLATHAAKLVISARNAEALEKTAESLRKQHGCDVTAVVGDVSNREDVKKVVDTAVQKYGRLDIFISNAGVMPVSLLESLEVDKWDLMLDVNVRGVTNAIAAALPIFRQQSSGHFVTVGSTAGAKTVPRQAIYSGTKHAVRAIMEGLRQEVGPSIRSTLITPGATLTSAFQSTPQNEEQAKQLEAYKKMAMDPAAVARCIHFALTQPPDVNIGEIIVRSSSQP